MIEILVDGRAFGDEGCGFSVLLRGPKQVWVRGIIPEKKKTTNQLDLIAIKFALLSLRDRNSDIILRYRNRYISHIFAKEDGDWKKKDITQNKELIDEVRDLTLFYPKAVLQHDPDNNAFKDLLSKTENMVRNKTPYFIK